MAASEPDGGSGNSMRSRAAAPPDIVAAETHAPVLLRALAARSVAGGIRVWTASAASVHVRLADGGDSERDEALHVVTPGVETLIGGLEASCSYYVRSGSDERRVTAASAAAASSGCVGDGCARCGQDSAWNVDAAKDAGVSYRQLSRTAPTPAGPVVFQLSACVAQEKCARLVSAGEPVGGDGSLRALAPLTFLHAVPAGTLLRAHEISSELRQHGVLLTGCESFCAADADAVIYETASVPAGPLRRAFETYMDTFGCLVKSWPRHSKYWVLVTASQLRLLGISSWASGLLDPRQMRVIAADWSKHNCSDGDSSSDDDILLTELVASAAPGR
jgi:hypothetical protein